MVDTLHQVKFAAPRTPPRSPQDAVPAATPLSNVLASCEPLLYLQQRLAQANARMEAIRPLLPSGLRSFVQSGSTDEEGWTLLASGPAVAAKLRQLLPRLEERLRSLEIRPSTIRIRVQSNRPSGR